METERAPYEREEMLPEREIGDVGSFEEEPEDNYEEPELERLDLIADEPPQKEEL